MDISKRLIAYCQDSTTSNEKSTYIDVDSFIRRILLHDTYILDSNALDEINHLVKIFGLEGVLLLLDSGILRIHCEPLSLIADITNLYKDKMSLSSNSYYLASAKASRHKCRKKSEKNKGFQKDIEYVEKCLESNVNPILGYGHKDKKSLKKAIKKSLSHPLIDFATDAFEKLISDLSGNNKILRTVILFKLKNDKKIDLEKVDLDKLEVHVFKPSLSSEGVISVETNLQQLTDLDVSSCRSIISSSLTGIGGAYSRLAQTKAFNALPVFSDQDSYVFDTYCQLILEQVSSEKLEVKFEDVIKVNELDFASISSDKVDAKKLLRIKETQECKLFVDWLSSGKDLDSNFHELSDRLKDKISLFAPSTQGKLLRFVASSGVGMIPGIGPLAGMTLGAFDGFFLEKFLWKPSPLSFINNLYPSIFKGTK